MRLLEAGVAGALVENPQTARSSDVVVVIGSNALSVAAVAAHAKGVLGYHTLRLCSGLEGSAKAAKVIVALLNAASAGPSESDLAPQSCRPRGVCLILGGETTVSLMNPASRAGPAAHDLGPGGVGLGGRNQELALAAALQLAATTLQEPRADSDSRGSPRFAVLSFGTDGGDGPTDAAGALATEWTVRAGAAAGFDAAAALARHDSHSFFKSLGLCRTRGHPSDRDEGCIEAGGLVRTGPTGTNVNDIVVALSRPSGLG